VSPHTAHMTTHDITGHVEDQISEMLDIHLTWSYIRRFRGSINVS
jgi:hypothetical protein